MLPNFVYHPDPVGTGSVVPSPEVCHCCQQARGFIYRGCWVGEGGPLILCPWCIADGCARDRLRISFVDNLPPDVPDAVRDLVRFRTPGFASFGEPKWLGCCGDACEYLGVASGEKLRGEWARAAEGLRRQVPLEGEEWERWLDKLSPDGSAVAFVFRCRYCGAMPGYWDFS